ncbi:MAG: PAS domain-containing sensor histidine kinase [Desulfobacteria bacterium]
MSTGKNSVFSVFGDIPNPELLLQELIDSMPAHIFLKDRENRFLLVNRSLAEGMGRSREEIVGHSAFDLFPEEHARKYFEDDLAVIATGEARIGISEPIEMVRGTRWLITHKVPHRDPQGNVIGVIGVAMDVTALREAEENHRSSNRALRMMWGCSSALLGAKDESKLLSEVCRIAVESGGYRLAWAGFAEDNPGKSVRPVAQFGFEDGYLQALSITWGDDPHGHGPTGRAIRTAAPVVARDILTDPSFIPWRSEALSRGYCSNAAFPLGTEGRPWGVLSIYAAEPGAFTEEEVRLLSELADTLAYGIRSLRAEAARGREEERRKSAEVALVRAQRMGVAKLAGGVAHNLNNLLTVINGYGFLLGEGLSVVDPRKGMLEEMLRSGERAAELTNQLLSYSRQQMLLPRELEVGGLLREMEPGLRKICGPGVALTVNSGDCVLRVDPVRFRQMLVRLLTYACEEMERTGSVEIHAFEADIGPGDAPREVGLAAGRYLVLTLRDSGPWMDSESQSNVFEPFRRPLESGGGLELSSVYGFVKQSGGYIWVESERGVGNRFIACFPAPVKVEDPPQKKVDNPPPHL